ncbi:SDR family oxidoreductase [Kockiozyma suomiensis]|uniref:SDR family oxidoreductase n=1 Tax=Kockiozyma suomiensis TaxID=1337062 RepID=UPI003343BBA6
MHVFVTGATGFVGSRIVNILLSRGHTVLALARNPAKAAVIASKPGVTIHTGSLTDIESLKAGALAADGVIHTAFVHDFTQYAANIAIDLEAIKAMVGVLKGTNKPFVSTSSPLLAGQDKVIIEIDPAKVMDMPTRGPAETFVLKSSDDGIRSSVVRLPIVHGENDPGFLTILMNLAKQKNYVGYIESGTNHWPSVEVNDAALLYVLALEKGTPGSVYHAIGEQGIEFREIASAIAKKVGLEVKSIPKEEAGEYYGWFAAFAGFNFMASSEITQKQLGWTPKGDGMVSEIGLYYS